MAPKKKYTPKQMGDAIEAVRKGSKISEAAERYGVPRVTLHNKITGKSPLECSMGPQTILSQYEEDIIVKWILAMSEKHFPINRELLKESVQKIVTEKGKPNPFTNNKPGKKWFQSFLKRHPEIVEKTAQNLTKSRDDVSEEDIRKWFLEVESYLEGKGLKDILKHPNRIFNTDESAFFLSPKPGKVLSKRGEQHQYKFSGDEKENLTVLITANAAGVRAPPMIVFKYERVPSQIAASVPDDWGIGKSESGWMCGSTFYEYITNIFNPWLEQEGIEKPVLFFLDGHTSHLTIQLSNFCSDNGIEVIALYPNSTHLLQPMDLAVFRPLKVAWRKEVAKWQVEHLGEIMKKEHFAPVLKNALSSITEDCIRNGFRAGGLHPFGPDYIDMTKIKRKQLTERVSDPRQTDFVKYLESQIIEIYSREKMQLFNDIYYKDRNTLEEILPTEDESLYVIWAKNKHATSTSVLTEPVNDVTSPPLPADPVTGIELNVDDAVVNAEDMTRKAMPSLSRTENSRVPSQNIADIEENFIGTIAFAHAEHKTGETVPSTSRVENSIEYVPSLSPSKNIADIEDNSVGTVAYANVEHMTGETVPSNTGTENSRESVSLLSRSKDIADIEENVAYANAEHITEETTYSTSRAENYNEAVPSTSRANLENEESVSTTQAATPRKRLEAALGVTIPSPFKNNLFWPEEVKNKKKRKREKIPYAITSKSWQNYHKKKQLEKQKLQEEKEERARLRQEKKIEKEKYKAKNKKQGLRKKDKIKKTQEDTDSEETDLEIMYAESDDSYNSDINEDSAKEYVKSPQVIKYKRQNCEMTQEQPQSKRRRINKSETDSEDEPLSALKSVVVKPGQFVIVNYEGEFFPGKVEGVDGKQFEISTMVLSTGNTFRWPDKPDKIWYREIVEIISKPLLLNKRGFYKIKEMDKYLPDLYDI